MPAGTPPQVKDTSRRTKVFDYRIPLRIDGRGGAIDGALFWAGTPGLSASRLIAAGAVIVVAGAALVFLSRRRRRPAGSAPQSGEQAREAW